MSDTPLEPKPELHRPQTIAEKRFAERADELTQLDLAARFARMYETNLWSGSESRSGDGSSLAATAGVRAGLPALFRQLGVRRLLDVPCGDFNWMAHLDLAAAGVRVYVGGDLVPEIVAANRARHSAPDREFVQVDLTAGPLPFVGGEPADAIFCRDCLVHLSFANIGRVVRVLRASGVRYLITTTFLEHAANIDVLDGDWRPLNLERDPFRFGRPVAVLVEGCEEEGGAFADKALGVWEISALPVSTQ
jgi:SAM-dependent methyltransferase